MSDGVYKFTVTFTFNAIRARFGERLYAHLLVWDEIRGENIVIVDSEKLPSDLTRPGEGFIEYRVTKIEPIDSKD